MIKTTSFQLPRLVPAIKSSPLTTQPQGSINLPTKSSNAPPTSDTIHPWQGQNDWITKNDQEDTQKA